ncbi:MAG: hypothetical protein ACW9WZ_04420 [Nitrosopumilus sp.]
MVSSLFGKVLAIRKFVSGDIEIDFQHDEDISVYRYSTDSSKSNFPKELAETLISAINFGICVEIFFDDSGKPTHLQLEECDEDDEFDDEDDEDSVFEES